MALGSLNPVAIQQFFDNNGNPLAGGKLSFFQAGTNTPAAAYSDPGLTVPLTNPLVLDAAGRTPTEVFLAALAYKQVLATSAGVTLWTADNIMSAAQLAHETLKPTITTLTAVGTVQDVDGGTGHTRILVCQNATDLTIGGVLAGADGDLLFVLSVGAGNVFLRSQDTLSQPTSQLANYAASGSSPLAAGYGSALYMYVVAVGRWRMVSHNQGHFLKVPYLAGNFVPSATTGSGWVWTVPQASALTQQYLLTGAVLECQITLGPTTVSGAPTHLFIGGWPYMFRSSGAYPFGLQAAFLQSSDMNTANGDKPAMGQVYQGESRIAMMRTAGVTPWANSNDFWLWGSMRFEVI